MYYQGLPSLIVPSKMMICGTMTLPYLFRIHLFGVGAKVEDSIISGLVTRQGVTGRNTCNWPIAFPSKCLMASAALTPNNANDDLWDADLFMYFTCTTVRRGGEGRNLYHIGVGV